MNTQILSPSHLNEFNILYALIQMNYMQCVELTTYFVTSVWDSRHGVVCVANMVRDGEVVMKRHHVFEVCTSEVRHLVMLSLIQSESKKEKMVKRRKALHNRIFLNSYANNFYSIILLLLRTLKVCKNLAFNMKGAPVYFTALNK